MKLSDFLIRGRHLFGFLIPGVMWVACLMCLSFKENPLEFVEAGPLALLASLINWNLANRQCKSVAHVEPRYDDRHSRRDVMFVSIAG